MTTNLSDRFARLAALRPASTRVKLARTPEAMTDPARCDGLTELLGAAVGRNRYGEHLQVRRWYSSPEPFWAGPEALAPATQALRLLLPRDLALSVTGHERAADPAEWLFLDTETTGLAGGTGTYAFLVGIAWWDDGGLQVEQFFMRDYTEEHSLLLELARRLRKRRVLVTYNGKSFDWPLLETRFKMTRAIAPPPPAAHLDLLHPARQLWRLRLGSVRLTELERQVLGASHLGWDRRDDIDSSLIPQVYFDYLRGGPYEPLTSVFRHNQMDLRGLAALAARILALLSDPEAAAGGATHVLELYGLSRLLDRRGDAGRARRLYERALDAGLPAPVDRAARRDLARLAKRQRDFARANALWQELLEGSFHRRDRAWPAQDSAEIETASRRGRRRLPRDTADLRPAPNALSSPFDEALATALEACEQLAIYYEHHARDYARAAALTRKALAKLGQALRTAQFQPDRYRRWQARLAHRLARLARASCRSSSLFAAASVAPGSASGESNQSTRRQRPPQEV